MAEGKEQNRIVYLEPNNIPAIKPILQGRKYNDGVSPDNLTWNPEDYNICVDIKVIIPSRDRHSGFDYEKNVLFNDPKHSDFFSLLHGNDLDEDKNFLTDEYTNVSYEEIRLNGAGSKEMLGISSINIKFDAHLYPMVMIKFTDVRAASLMSPAEKGFEDKGRKQDIVCRNFFSALFRYPFPIFMLTVKGFYGTKVSFRLSTYDFKSAYNADTGNFDVTVQFIGSMYGVYTDIPFRFILAAPYIGATNGGTNDYWTKQTSNGGPFFYNSDGQSQHPIKTFIEFYRDSVNALKNGNGIIDEGEEGIAGLRENNALKCRIDGILDSYRNLISNLFVSSIENKIGNPIHGKINGNRDEEEFFILFISEKDAEIYEEKKEELEKTAKNIIENCTGVSLEPPKICQEIVDGTIKTYGPYIDSDGRLTKDGEDIGHYLPDVLNNLVGKNSVEGKNAIKVDDNFISKCEKRKSELEDSDRELKKKASKEMVERYTRAIGFEPTVENAFRMLFAHLDTFVHLYYECIDSISSSRNLSDFSVDIKDTDIDSSSEESVFMPPFTGFYRKSADFNEIPEEYYPGDVAAPQGLREIAEVKFIEDIFKGMDSLSSMFPPESETTSDDGSTIPIESNVGGKDFHINDDVSTLIPTDIFYEGRNPYNLLKSGSEKPKELFHFFAARCYAFNKAFTNDTIFTRFIEEEFRMLTASPIWKKIIGTEYGNGGGSRQSPCDFYDSCDEIVDSASISKKEGEYVYKIEEYKHEKPLIIGKKFFSRDSDKSGHTENLFLLNGSDGYSVNSIESFSDSIWRYPWTCGKFFPAPLSKTRNGYAPYYDYTRNGIDYSSAKSNDNEILVHVDELDAQKTHIYVTEDGEIKTETISDFYVFYNFMVENPDWPLWIQYVKSPNWEKTNGTKEGNVAEKNNYFFGDFWKDIHVDSNGIVNDYKQAAYIFLKSLNHDSSIDLKHHKNSEIWCYMKIGYLILGSVFSQSSAVEINKKVEEYGLGTVSNANSIKEYFEKWAESDFKDILRALYNEKTTSGVKYYGRVYDSYVRVFDPNGEFNRKVEALYREMVYAMYLGRYDFLDDSSYPGKDKRLMKMFLDKIKDAISERRKYEKTHDVAEDGGTTLLTSSSDNTFSINDSYAQRLSCYRTLKSLYDRWFSTYKKNIWKLKTPEKEEMEKRIRFTGTNDSRGVNEGNYSEFDSFVYVDKFYNDISKKFIFNPSLLNKLIETEMDRSTDHSVLSFISEFCRQNKLLFKCLPIYNSLYSPDTLKKMFTPLSPYSGENRMGLGEGNTYVIMYPGEPSKSLNIPFDGRDGVGYRDDFLDIADINGTITDVAKEILNNGNVGAHELKYNICAFGVTPNAQNQSYFTKVSVGMDSPKVTEQSVGMLFEISRRYSRGGIGTGVGAGQDIYSIYSNRSYDCRVDMMGCANIMPMMYFQLNNLPMFRGAYMIMSVEHNIQNNTMTTSFVGQRQSKYLTPLDAEIFNVAGLSDIVSNTTGLLERGNINSSAVEGSKPPRGTWRAKGENNDFYALQKDAEVENTSRTFFALSACEQLKYNFYYATESRSGITYVTKTSQHLCASALKAFLWAGFNGYSSKVEETKYALSGNGISDYGMGSVGSGYFTWEKLQKLGFRVVASAPEIADATFKPQTGDVAVMRCNGTKYGHVCMYVGTQWVSDFTQNNLWVYNRISPFPTNETDVLIYRYYGKIDLDNAKEFQSPEESIKN